MRCSPSGHWFSRHAPPPTHYPGIASLGGKSKQTWLPAAQRYPARCAKPGWRCIARYTVCSLDPDRELVPLIGSKEGIFNLMMALVNPGDVVLIPDPGYITYTRGVQFAGGGPYYLPLEKDSGYLPDLDSVPQKVLRRSRVLWLNYPNNPTAAIAPEKFFSGPLNLPA